MTSSFTLGTYLRDRWMQVAAGVVAAITASVMVSVLGATPHGALAVGFVVLAFSALSLAVDYLRVRSFYCELEDVLAQIEDGYYLPSLIQRPHFLEGALLYDACTRIAKIDSDCLTAERERAAANREYVELWTHEVKTPLAAAKLLLRRMHGADAMALRRELERVESSCERALYNARTSTLANDYVVREVNLGDECREACKDLVSLLVESGIQLNFDIDPQLTVLSDSQWVRFMIKQVVSNSGKYGAKTISFSASVENEGTPQGRTLLCIADDGIGIPEGEVGLVFQRGYSGTNGRKQGNSTGMGLYLAGRACRLMGIGLSISSEEGAGTTVTFAFPHNRDRLELEAS